MRILKIHFLKYRLKFFAWNYIDVQLNHFYGGIIMSLLENFLIHGLARHSSSTIRTYRYVLEQFAEWLEGAGANLETFARSDVQQYIDYLTAKGKSAATINKVWNAIRSFAQYANKTDAIDDIRVIKMPDYRNEAPKALDRNDRNRVIREADRSGNKRDFAIIMMLLGTGIRVSELCALNRSDIEISERKGTARIRGKGNKERYVNLNAEVRRALKLYLDSRTDEQEALFLSNRNKRISVRSVQVICNKYGVHPHALRHTFITDLVRKGIDLTTVQALSGHASFDMVARYSKPSEEDKQAAVERLFID
jgi:integrase/recombinase XerD